jgi:hypothetical protein
LSRETMRSSSILASTLDTVESASLPPRERIASRISPTAFFVQVGNDDQRMGSWRQSYGFEQLHGVPKRFRSRTGQDFQSELPLSPVPTSLQ